MKQWIILLFLCVNFSFTNLLLADPIEKTDTVTTTDKQSKNFIYYNPDGIGAHAFYTPWSLVLESGFEAVYDARVDNYPYKLGFDNLLTSLENPKKLVKQYGVKNFILDQFVPQFRHAGWVPNYTWHLIGGGFRTRLLTEYYEYNDFPYPKTAAWVTLYLGNILNEIQQAASEDLKNGSIDPLPDLLFFDWVGKLLFSFDPVAKLAAEKFHLTEWTFQMAINPVTKRLINNGQQYSLRMPIYGPISLGFTSGNMVNTVNIVYSPTGEQQWILGIGGKPGNFIVIGGREIVPTSTTLAGMLAYAENDNPIVTVFYKKKESKLATQSDISFSEKLFVNVYPKWIDLWGVKPSFTLAWQNESLFFGVGCGSWPVGLAASTSEHAIYRDDP